MGRASGSSLAECVWNGVRNFIPKGFPRVMSARKIIETFEDYDCDTVDEAEQLCRDAGRQYDEEQDEIVYGSPPPEEILPPATNLDALRVLYDLFQVCDLGDYVYDIRDWELKGWEGPRVRAWGNACLEAKRLLKGYKPETKQPLSEEKEP